MPRRGEQLRLFVSPRYQAESERARAQGYTSSASASRFASSLLWSDIRGEAEAIGIDRKELARDGALRLLAYRWWLEDKGDRLRSAYLRAPLHERPSMRGYRKGLSSAANQTLIRIERRTPSMRFAVGDTQKHLPSYFNQLQRAGIPIRGRMK